MMKPTLTQILLSFALATVSLGIEAEELVQSSEPRICRFLPNLVTQLAVEPAVPDNFVAMSPSGTPDAFDWIWLGPKDVLEAYFKDPSTLNQAVIRVMLCKGVVQTGPNEFNGSTEKFIEDAKNKMSKDLTAKIFKWGDYPVVEMNISFLDRGKLHTAWVGLNDRSSGGTLLFGLEVPEIRKIPNEVDMKLWDNFIQNTKPLTGYDLYRAHGHDMQTGYTIYTFAERKIKAIAEKRESDKAVQVIVQPLSPNTTFECEEMDEGLHGGEWRHMDPLVKLHGAAIIDDDGWGVHDQCVISIFPQTVKEFTDASKIPNSQVYSMKKSGVPE